MRPFALLFIIVTIVGAIAAGWIYESRSKTTVLRPEIEIPTDIDYFLDKPKYLSFNQAGNLDYQLQSPYLEHFTRDDISRLKEPRLEVYRAGGDWHVNASRGDIYHQKNWLKLSDDVFIQKQGPNGMQARSESMLFEADRNILSSEETVVIESGNSRIRGDKAVFDLENEVYTLKNTRSIYYHDS